MTGIVHVHPTLLCNLACRHCYSDSGPQKSGELPLALIEGVLGDAWELGYDVLSLSGGEPLLYRSLPHLITRAVQIGYRVQLVSNGYFIPRAVDGGTLDALSTVAISVDGYGARHNTMRGHSSAWKMVLRALDALSSRHASVGLNLTLRADNLDDLEAIVGLAVERGLGLLQLHPFEADGRGRNLPEPGGADHDARCYASAAIISAALHGRMRVQCDLMPSCQVPQMMPADTQEPCSLTSLRLADALPVLVLDANGQMRPLSYSMPASFALGNANEHRLAVLARNYLIAPSGLARLHSLWRNLAARLSQPCAPAVVNLYGALSKLAHASAA